QVRTRARRLPINMRRTSLLAATGPRTAQRRAARRIPRRTCRRRIRQSHIRPRPRARVTRARMATKNRRMKNTRMRTPASTNADSRTCVTSRFPQEKYMPANKPFLSDIEAIRARARKDLDKGAVTAGYRADRTTVLRLLNESLATEIV